MDNDWTLALIKIGVPALVGGFCDYGLMYPHQRKQLREFLADAWLRMSDVKWPAFGRTEAEIAAGIIGQIAGERLLSKQRAVFIVSVAIGAVAFSCGIHLAFGA